ncbi:hypothetical protein BD770DRAFT_432877, partial [Pilaira anomala]
MPAGRSYHGKEMRYRMRARNNDDANADEGTSRQTHDKKITKNYDMRKLIVEKKNIYLMTPTEISKELHIPRTTVNSICKKFAETGEIAVSNQPGRPTIWTDEMEKAVDDMVIASDGTITLRQLREELLQAFPNMTVPSYTSICDYLNYDTRLMLKKIERREDNRNKQDTIKERKVYCQSLLTEGVDYMSNCIFVDESGFNVNMVRGQARARPNEPAIVHIESKKAENISILMAISSRGIELCSVKLVQAGTSGTIFNEFMGELLNKVEASASYDTNGPYFFIMDNARFHYNKELKE